MFYGSALGFELGLRRRRRKLLLDRGYALIVFGLVRELCGEPTADIPASRDSGNVVKPAEQPVVR